MQDLAHNNYKQNKVLLTCKTQSVLNSKQLNNRKLTNLSKTTPMRSSIRSCSWAQCPICCVVCQCRLRLLSNMWQLLMLLLRVLVLQARLLLSTTLPKQRVASSSLWLKAALRLCLATMLVGKSKVSLRVWT